MSVSTAQTLWTCMTKEIQCPLRNRNKAFRSGAEAQYRAASANLLSGIREARCAGCSAAARGLVLTVEVTQCTVRAANLLHFTNMMSTVTVAECRLNHTGAWGRRAGSSR